MELDEILQEAYADASRVIDFGRGIWTGANQDSIRPKMHQLVRIHEAVRNGRRRLLCADTTSAGKTFTAVAIKGLLDKDLAEEGKKKSKALVVAPNQALEGAWDSYEVNKYTSALRLPQQDVVTINANTLDQAHRGDFLLINYDKFSMQGDEGNKYVRMILDNIDDIDMVIVDESHNLKNIATNRARAFIPVVESSKDKRFLMLSASPIPNRLKDAGFLLYMLDPERYAHYRDAEFSYEADQYSIMNAINSGSWFTFSRDDVQALYDLPTLQGGNPELGLAELHEYPIDGGIAQAYFDVWNSETSGMEKIARLSTVLLQSAVGEIGGLVDTILSEQPDAAISVFSFYKTGFHDPLKERLSLNGSQVEVISGDVKDVGERVARAKRFTSGKTQVLINSIQTVSESISMTTGDRPCYIIFAEPPIVPANFDQAIGRHYRIRQAAPVYHMELVPQSAYLNDLMLAEKKRLELAGAKFDPRWVPGTIFEDKVRMRRAKAEAIDRVVRGQVLGDLAYLADVGEGFDDPGVYSTMLK